MIKYTLYLSVGAVVQFLVFVLASTSSSDFTVTFIENKTTIVSPSKIFELGLFRAGNHDQETVWYLGIWFKRFPNKVVWVANRDNPLSNSTGILRISNSILLLLDLSDSAVWNTNLTSTGAAPVVADLLDNGNFVLRYSNSRRSSDGFLWQSFDYPTDTLLPGMELRWTLSGLNGMTILRSWSGDYDPSSGHFVYQIDAGSGHIQGYTVYNGKETCRVDPIYIPGNGTIIDDNASYTFKMGATTTSYYATLRLTHPGRLIWSQWTPADREWKNVWKLPYDGCDGYQFCAPNAYCIMKPMHSCDCLQGFRDSHSGCVRKSQLTCDDDGFQLMKNMKLPELDWETIVKPNINSKECEYTCLKNCNCTAFANTYMPNGQRSCMMWIGDLRDIRRYSDDQGRSQDLYVKFAARDLEKHFNKKKWYYIVGFTLGGGVLLLLGVIFWQKKRISTAFFGEKSNKQELPMETRDEWISQIIEFDVIAEATNGFSDENKIGSGGFGNVYKGRLLDGQEIAVKRLYKLSDDGILGFSNEVNLIKKLQHINLVRLLGYFFDDREKILVYEFLENSSLDAYLFDATRRSIVTWERRLDITKGIARGLVYLHQDSRIRIIHLDLKASNVLLGKDIIPKISDFGMAKTLEGDDTEAVASTAAGTLGYMAPEYRAEHIYSPKSDVYSFGVMLLEIISGKKIKEFSRLNNGEFFLSFVWTNWSEGKGLEIVDPVIKDFAPEEALRCIQIGLLCVQGNARDRPMMSSVLLMLGSETELIDTPKSPLEIGESSRQLPRGESYTMSKNQMTMSTIVPR